jgi:hypothetical protein
MEARFGSGAPEHFGKRGQPLRLVAVSQGASIMERAKLTVLLLLRQALLGNLDVSLSGLESFYSTLGVIDRGSRGPDVEELRRC